MSALTALIAAEVARPDFAEIPASYHEALCALTPSTAVAMACDHLALSSALRTVTADAMTQPSEAHDAWLAALRNDDDAGFATLTRQLVARALSEAAMERAYVALQRQRGAAYTHERRKAGRPN